MNSGQRNVGIECIDSAFRKDNKSAHGHAMRVHEACSSFATRDIIPERRTGQRVSKDLACVD